MLKFVFSEKATKFEKIFVELLTSASCSVFSAHVLNFTANQTHLFSQLLKSVSKGPSINDVGNFFWIFDTPLPHVGSFLVLAVGNF